MNIRAKHTLIRLSIVFYYTFSNLSVMGQNGFANHWHINNKMHVDFSLGEPFVDTISALNSFQSSISYSNTNGELLFYSNEGGLPGSEYFSSGNFWNRNHEVMPNGSLGDTVGCQSSADGGVVIPDVSDPNIYWVFTSDCNETQWTDPSQHIGLRYTKIDMSLDGGLGDLVEKGVPVYGDSSHKIAESIGATRHSNGVDYWLIMHGYNYPESDTFYVFLFSEGEVSSPLIQTIGSPVDGKIEISPDGKKMICGNELYTFNKSTGEISNPINLEIELISSSFSANSNFLYAVDAQNLYQYNVYAVDLLESRMIIHHEPDETTYHFISMQLGPNCKIYVSRLDDSSFGVINLVNEPGLACNYVHNQFVHGLPYWHDPFRFPNFIDSEFACETANIEKIEKDDFNIYQAADGQSIQLSLNPKWTGNNIEILDIYGRLISQHLITDKNTEIDVSNLSPGTYVIHVPVIEKSKKFLRF